MPTDISNRTSNTSSEEVDDLIPAWECTPWIVLLVLECLAIVILNVITIIVFLTQRPLQRRGIYSMIRHLAMVDLLTGAISGPLQVERLGEYCDVWEYDEFLTWGFLIKFALLHLFSFASLANLVAISLERVHATLFPSSHILMNKRVYYIMVSIIWLIAVAREATQIVLMVPEDAEKVRVINSTLYIAYYLISLLIILFSYVTIFIKIRFGPFINPTSNSAIIKERRLTSTLFTVTVASLLSLLPVIIFLSIETFSSESVQKLSFSSYFHVRMAVVTLFLANSLANPIIYSMRMQGFREGLANLLIRAPSDVNGADVPLHQL